MDLTGAGWELGLVFLVADLIVWLLGFLAILICFFILTILATRTFNGRIRMNLLLSLCATILTILISSSLEELIFNQVPPPFWVRNLIRGGYPVTELIFFLIVAYPLYLACKKTSHRINN